MTRPEAPAPKSGAGDRRTGFPSCRTEPKDRRPAPSGIFLPVHCTSRLKDIYLWNRIDPNAYSLPVPYDPDIHTFRYPDSRVRTRFAAAPQSELRSGGGPARPPPERVAERSTAVPTARSGRKSFRNDGEILPLCRYATKHPEKIQPSDSDWRVRSRRAAPVPA